MADPIDRQHDEIASLKSIYADIFTDVTPTNKVWNRDASPHFQISLHSHENVNRPVVSLVLDIKFTPTYPISSPIIQIVDSRNILRARLAQIKAKIDETLKEYPGEEICFTVIMDIKEMLDDMQQTTEQVLSLEEERAKRIQKERESLEQREKEVLRKEQSAKMKKEIEANRQILQMKSDYLEGCGRIDPVNTVDSSYPQDMDASSFLPPPCSEQIFVFDNIISGELPRSNARFLFQAVQGFISYEGRDLLSSIGKQYIVKPYLPALSHASLHKVSSSISYLLNVISLNDKHWSTISGKSEIRKLELELQSIMAISSDSILKVVGFQIDQDSIKLSQWTIRILTEFESNQQSIMDIISAAGYVNWSLARSWLIRLLPSLENLHTLGLSHGLICPQSLALWETKSELDKNKVKEIKLCHPTYALSLLKIKQRSDENVPGVSYIDNLIPSPWTDPDATATMAKTDIWQLGVLFMRVMLGFDVLETKFETPESFLSNFDINEYPGIEEYAERVYDILRKMIQPKASKRSSLLELNASKFFRASFDVAHETVLEHNTKYRFLQQLEYLRHDPKNALNSHKKTLEATRRNDKSIAHRRRSSHPADVSGFMCKKVMDKTTFNHDDIKSLNQSESRYVREFEEIGKLGKGAFGEVVKARNKMEGTFYAIKKIKHRQDKLENLLTEVFSLARLNHQYIVRYYGCWVEEDLQLSGYNESAVGCEDDDMNSSEDSLSDLNEFQTPLNPRPSSFLTSREGSFQVDYFTNSVNQLTYDDEFDDRIVFTNSDDESEDDFKTDNDSDSDSDSDSNSNSDSDSDSDSDDTSSAEVYSSGKEEESSQAQKEVFTKISNFTKARSILYIQMEFCENNTLSDLIDRGLPENSSEYWRLFRQTLEAVSYIHSSGFIHRDLKPTNIFIDKSNNIKVGDFGLAKNSHFLSALSQNNQVSGGEKDLSTVVGTFFYTAKEVATGQYDEKVDMYSLGVIFFEMCYQLQTGMERALILNNLRLKEIKFPSDFSEKNNEAEKRVICKLLQHEPKNRPEASELLQSGLLPVEHQDIVIKEALKSLADPASPWQHQVRETLFNQPYSLARDLMFDRSGKKPQGSAVEPYSSDCIIFSQCLASVVKIFKNHGALQEFSGSFLMPKSPIQSKDFIYDLLDRSGAVLTLGYDLVLPLARYLSREHTQIKKSYAHEFVFRPSMRGTGNPDKYSAVSFDVFSHTRDSLLSDSAECLKAMDEILAAFPCFKVKTCQAYIVVNHMDILNCVIDFAFGANHSMSPVQRYELIGVLSQLGIERGAEDLKNYLRNDFKIQHTIVKDLIDLFDFTVEPEQAGNKLRRIMVDSPLLSKVEDALTNLSEIIQIARKLGITSKILFSPLSNYNAKYYDGSLMFQVVFRIDKNRKFARLATGGRYDSLIESLPNEGSTILKTPHSVGFQLTMTLLFLVMKNSRKKLLSAINTKNINIWKPVRCDVLIVSFQKSIIEDWGLELIGDIWAHQISCDWYVASSHEDIANKADADGCNWIIHIKQSMTSVRKTKRGQYKPIRVRNVQLDRETDLDYNEVVCHLTTELRERDSDNSYLFSKGKMKSSSNDYKDAGRVGDNIGEPIFNFDIDQKVVVIPNLTKGKKSNKRDKSEQETDSKIASARMLKDLAQAPVLTIDSSDAVLDMISSTSLLVQREEWLKRAFSTNKQLPRSFGVSIYEALQKEADRGTRWVVLHAPKTDKTTIVDLHK